MCDTKSKCQQLQKMLQLSRSAGPRTSNWRDHSLSMCNLVAMCKLQKSVSRRPVSGKMQGVQSLAVSTVGAWRQSPANKPGHYSNIGGIHDCGVRQGPICVFIFNTKLLAKRRKTPCWLRERMHRIQRGLQDMVMFKGSMNASVLLNQTVRVLTTVFSLVHFSPDQSLPPRMGLNPPLPATS